MDEDVSESVLGFWFFKPLKFELWTIRGEFVVQGIKGGSTIEGMSAKVGGGSSLKQGRCYSGDEFAGGLECGFKVREETFMK